SPKRGTKPVPLSHRRKHHRWKRGRRNSGRSAARVRFPLRSARLPVPTRPGGKTANSFSVRRPGQTRVRGTNHPFKWSRPAKYAERRGLSIDHAGRSVSVTEGAPLKRLGLLNNYEGTSAGGRYHAGSTDPAGHRDREDAEVLGLLKLSVHGAIGPVEEKHRRGPRVGH